MLPEVASNSFLVDPSARNEIVLDSPSYKSPRLDSVIAESSPNSDEGEGEYGLQIRKPIERIMFSDVG